MLRSQLPKLRLAGSNCLKQCVDKDCGKQRSFYSSQFRPQSTRKNLSYCDISASEVRACYRLFKRSGLTDASGSKFHRFWVLSSSNLPRISACHFHTSQNQNFPKVTPPDDKPDEDDKKKNDDENIERLLSMFKALIGFFLVPVMILLVFSDRSERRQDPSTVDPRFQTQQQQQQQQLLQFQQEPGNSSRIEDITWSEFYNKMLMAGEVEEIIVYPAAKVAFVVLRPNAIYKGQRLPKGRYRMRLEDKEDLEDRIRTAEAKLGIPPGEGISIKYQRKTENIAAIFGVVFIVGILALLFYGGRNLRSSISSINPFLKMSKADFTLVDPQIRTGKGVKFSDVAGLKEAKIEVKEFVDYLKNPDKYKELGAKPPKGALLTGPPGCGKTMLAKAVANEASVPFLSMNGSEFIEMIGGLGAARVRNLFAEARKRSPSIIYIDEIDAIGRKRSGGSSAGGGTGEAEQTLNQLLVEMDGIASKEGVIMLASTNRGDVLDKALLRPGRFDRHIMIDLPTMIERKEILEQHMKGVKLDHDPAKYSERLATLTPGFSGADLANVINEAALHAARIKYDKVKADNLEYAIERVIAGPEKKTNVLSPNERRVVAYHESGHALVGWMLKHTDALLKVTILPRTSQALGFAQYTPIDKKLYCPDELMDRMCMALGGRVAESLTFNKITTGAQNDLEKVTKMAYSQIKYFGFNEKIGLVSFEQDSGGSKPFSKALHATMDHEARLLIAEAYHRTEAVIRKHKEQLAVMAEALLAKETLNYDDVEKLLGPPPHGKKHLVTPVDFENSLNQQSKLGAEVNAGLNNEK